MRQARRAHAGDGEPGILTTRYELGNTTWKELAIEFSETVASWSTFYDVVAGAAATLLGLLFVSLALNPAVMRDDSPNGMRIWAGQTFHNFLILLAISLVVIMPDQTAMGVGIPLVILGAQGVYRVIRDIRIAMTDPDPAWRGKRAVFRFASPGVAYALCLWAGVLALREDADAMGWLIAVVFLLVMGASASSWDLLKEIGNPDKG